MSVGQSNNSTVHGKLPFNASNVHGLPVMPHCTEEHIDKLTAWPILPGDVYLVTYPKSGTTWTQLIIQLARNNGVDDNNKRLDLAIPWMDGPPAIFDPQTSMLNIPTPRAYKSHLNYQMVPGGPMLAESPAKYIYVARNPKDTAVSYFHQCKALDMFDFGDDWDCFFQHFCQGEAPFGDWFDHVLGWWKLRDSPNILFLRYEDMKRDPHQAVCSIATFIGHNLEPQVVESIVKQSSFGAMQKKSEPILQEVLAPMLNKDSDFKFFRKGVKGDWKNYFTKEQNSQFDEMYSKRMKGTGLEFDF